MKLMIIIVRDSEGDAVVEALVGKGYRVTRMASSGGFLHRGNVTLLTGVEDGSEKKVLGILRQVCRSTEDDQHRATVFIVKMSSYEQL
jgi:uncharacterized protein YaaQ